MNRTKIDRIVKLNKNFGGSVSNWTNFLKKKHRAYKGEKHSDYLVRLSNIYYFDKMNKNVIHELVNISDNIKLLTDKLISGKPISSREIEIQENKLYDIPPPPPPPPPPPMLPPNLVEPPKKATWERLPPKKEYVANPVVNARANLMAELMEKLSRMK